MSRGFRIFVPEFDLVNAIEQTRDQGYFFAHNSLSKNAQNLLQYEIRKLPLEVGDHITKPINKGKTNQVKQQHARFYAEYGDAMTPVANIAIEALAKQVRSLGQFSELRAWHLTEIGYQHYRNKDDFIGPHRDRGSDKLLSLTFSITGSALIKIFRMLDTQGDYSLDNLEQTDECMTRPRTTMFLRAPGLGNGEQVIHQVLHPETDERTILNLRMRPTVLEQPSDPKWSASA